MMKKVLVYIFVCLVSVLSASAQYRNKEAYDGLYDGETGAAMRAHVGELSAAALEGRKAGSEGEKYAAEYVYDKFKEYGLELLSPKGGDVFGIKTENGDTLTSRNVVACLQGTLNSEL